MVLVSKPKRATSIHAKRRTGRHHKRTSEYRKTYWPYLPLVMIVGLGMLVNSLWPTLQNVLGYATDMSITGLLSETNAQRSSGGLATLKINSKLNQAAQAKANDMAARNYWSHNTPDGTEPWVFFNQAGYAFDAAGENLAYGFDTSNATVVAWMNSPGHRANILNSRYEEVGFGIINVKDYQETGEQTVVVAMYGDPSAAPAPAEAKPAPVVQNTKPSSTSPQPTPAPTPGPTENQPSPSPAAEPEVIAPNNTQDSPKSVARIQLITDGAAPWSLFALSALAAVAIAIFVLRHGLFWKRAWIKGEAFVVKHPVLDIALVGIAVLGFILTRSAGSIY